MDTGQPEFEWDASGDGTSMKTVDGFSSLLRDCYAIAAGQRKGREVASSRVLPIGLNKPSSGPSSKLTLMIAEEESTEQYVLRSKNNRSVVAGTESLHVPFLLSA
ncbi:hypothetical protein E4U19_003288 [Claviceps sp. Clav32 group G5]|nr:hypothetical protein E4U19_003288 [Claviceps sp. Clav32 group G5]